MSYSYGTPILLRTSTTVRELHLVPYRAQLELSAFGTNADAPIPPLTTHTRIIALGHAGRVTIRVAEPQAAERGLSCLIYRFIMIRCSSPKQEAF